MRTTICDRLKQWTDDGIFTIEEEKAEKNILGCVVRTELLFNTLY